MESAGRLTERPSMQDREAPTARMRDRQLALLGFNFVLDMAGDGIPGLKPLESLLMMAVNQANIAPLTRDPAVRARHGALEAPAPDELRRPVSIRAVAASMRMPYETARRNIRRLESQGVCVTSEAGVVVPAAFMLTEAYFEAARLGHERLLTLYRVLRARQLLEPLPAPNYQEGEPPVRAAVRLMSDFLLRSADAVVGRTGDLVSGLVILPLLTAAAAAEEARPVPFSAAALARRTRLPAETVRRHVVTLLERGLCVSEAGGLRLADPALATPAWRGLMHENAVAVQRLYAGLAERGVVAVWERMAGMEAAPPAQGAA
jgi:hypothetical protein